MGRLNYTNRKIDGIKLGQVCAKDLQKRIPPASGSKAALRDPVVELDVSSKVLTDMGCAEVTGALIRTYHGNREDSSIFWLEELNLKDNALTPAALWDLSEVIRLANNHLRDLDLSNNSLCIKSREDIEAWDHFLYSLSGCCVLRRIDLSGNDIGCKGFEILAKVYSQASPVDFVLPSHMVVQGVWGRPSVSGSIDGLEDAARNLSIGSRGDNSDIESEIKTGKPKGALYASRTLEKHGHSIIEEELFQIYSTTRGLRSVPYIVLSNTSIDDTSVLHLSYVLANHHPPEQLLSRVPPAKAGAHAQQLLAYDTETGCRGVIYLPNMPLSSAASKVLDLAEKARLVVGHTPIEENGYVGEFGKGIETAGGLPRSPVFNQPRSSCAIGEETQEAVAADLDRARSRIQGYAIENAGHRSNDLWRVAFKMLSISRCIQPQTTKDAPPLTQAPKAKAKPKPAIIRTLNVPGPAPKKASPWGIPLAPRSVNQAISATPRSQKPSISTTPVLAVANTEADKADTYPVTRRQYRSKLPCGFSEDVWWQILGYAVGAKGLLSHGQQKSVLTYAMDRGNLKKEREALGLKEAAQKWHILEDMDCLAYEMR